MLDLLAFNQVTYNQAAFTIIDVVQDGPDEEDCIVTFTTNAAQMPDFPASNTTVSFEASRDGGATWPDVVGGTFSIDLSSGVSQTVEVTAAGLVYSTGMRVRIRWSHPFLGTSSYSPYSNVFAPTWDYWNPATSRPTVSFTVGDDTFDIIGLIPVGNFPGARFVFITDTNDGAGIGLGPGGSDIINPKYNAIVPLPTGDETIDALIYLIDVPGYRVFNETTAYDDILS